MIIRHPRPDGPLHCWRFWRKWLRQSLLHAFRTLLSLWACSLRLRWGSDNSDSSRLLWLHYWPGYRLSETLKKLWHQFWHLMCLRLLIKCSRNDLSDPCISRGFSESFITGFFSSCQTDGLLWHLMDRSSQHFQLWQTYLRALFSLPFCFFSIMQNCLSDVPTLIMGWDA